MRSQSPAMPAQASDVLKPGVRLRLKTCGFLATCILVLNFAMEITAYYDGNIYHPLGLSVLLVIFSTWSFLEAATLSFPKQEHQTRVLRLLLILQIALVAARTVLIFFGQDSSADFQETLPQSSSAESLVFVPLYIAVFIALNQTIQDILFGSARLAAEGLRQEMIITARLKERERFLQDLHDGLGSHLVAAKIRTQRTEVPQAEFINILSDCIEDLHLIVDVMKDEHLSFHAAMTDFRHRISSRMQNIGINITWDLQAEGLPEIKQSSILQIMRIAQEALTNAVRHSKASEIQLQVKAVDGGVLVLISDNGTGFVPNPHSVGQGLRNMHQRARSIDALLHIERHDGTKVRLHVPAASLVSDEANRFRLGDGL